MTAQHIARSSRKGGRRLTARVVVLAAALVATAGAAAADEEPSFNPGAQTIWGAGRGTTWGKLAQPLGIAAAPDGTRYYVADAANNRIVVLGPAGHNGVVDTWGADANLASARPREFNHPEGVAVDPWGTVIVADTGNGRIQRIAANGSYLGSVDLPGVVAVATDQIGSIYALTRFFNTVVWMTSTGKKIAAWQARPPVASEPLEPWTQPPTGNTKPRMTVTRALYSLSTIAAGPGGSVIVGGKRTLETSYDCAAVNAQLPLHNATAPNDPTIGHAFAWAFDPADGRTLGATDLTLSSLSLSRTSTEACWSEWAYGADTKSLVVGPGGHVETGMNSDVYEGLWPGKSSPIDIRWVYPRPSYPNPFTDEGQGSWGGRLSLATTCRGSLLMASEWSGYVYEYAARSTPAATCNAKPPKPTIALGPPVLAPSGRSVAATVACPGKGCSVVVNLEPAPRCKACTGLLAKTAPKVVRLPAGGITRLTFPLTRDARTSIQSGAPLSVRLSVPQNVAARGGGPIPLKLPTSLSLGCSPAGDTVQLHGRATGMAAGATIALAINGADGAQRSVLAKTRADGSFAALIEAPTSGRWSAAASFDGSANRSEAVSGQCAITVTVPQPAPVPVPQPAPAPTPIPPPPPATPPAATLSLSCSTSGDPATGGVTLQAHGILTPGQAGRTITVSFSAAGQPGKSATATTNVDGGWSASVQAPPNTWSAVASFTGDATAGGATANAGCK